MGGGGRRAGGQSAPPGNYWWQIGKNEAGKKVKIWKCRGKWGKMEKGRIKLGNEKKRRKIGVYQNGNFYRGIPKTTPGKNREKWLCPHLWKIFLLRPCSQYTLLSVTQRKIYVYFIHCFQFHKERFIYILHTHLFEEVTTEMWSTFWYFNILSNARLATSISRIKRFVKSSSKVN